jgi:hypothetical protein
LEVWLFWSWEEWREEMRNFSWRWGKYCDDCIEDKFLKHAVEFLRW